MNSQLTAYVTLVCTSGVLNLYLCLYVYAKRYNYKNIANFFVLYATAIVIYCFASAFGLMAMTLTQMKFWTVIQYVGLPFSSPLGLLFIMQYLGIKVTRKRFISLLILPFITLIMVATNELHHLYYRSFEVDPALGVPYIQQEIGIWYMIHGVYIFACMFVAFLLLVSHWKETAKIYRPQLIALMIGQLVPILTAFIYLIGFAPPGVDPVPMVMWLTSLLYLWAISSSRLFAVMPVAKNAIFNSISDGVIVLDETHRLIEFNQASKSMLPQLDRSLIGKDFDKVWQDFYGEVFPLQLENVVRSRELPLTSGHIERIYRVHISPLEQAGDSKGSLIIFSDITELKSLQVKLEQQAYYDELTQVYNRRAFMEKGEQTLTVAKKASSPFTVILMDIDFFKNVNDTYGHHIGDQLLVHVANVCQAELEKEQLFARYGGEEFVLALDGYTISEAEALGNQLRGNLETYPLVTAEGLIAVTLSLGAAETNVGTKETLYQLLNKADKALYAAKQGGRNQVRVYTEERETAN